MIMIIMILIGVRIATIQAVPVSVNTFSVSFVIGTSGAGVYLVLLLLTDRALSILDNKILYMSKMVILFIISGGVVPGITQTATGTAISANNVHNVFMVGLGWPGIISGAGGSSKVAEERTKMADEMTEEREGVGEVRDLLARAEGRG